MQIAMAALVEDHKCSICMVGYMQDRPPKLLACGHSFCPPCLVTSCADNATCPTCKQRGPGSPSTLHVPSLEQPKTSGQIRNVDRSSEPSLPQSNDENFQASHGSFCIRNMPATIIDLRWLGESLSDVRRLVEEMRPPPDALVWGKLWGSSAPDYAPPQMSPTTETISVGLSWAEAVRGVREAEKRGHKMVVVAPVATAPITRLLDHIVTHRQHAAATHVIVVNQRQDRMTRWQQQLVEDARMMAL